MRLLVALFGAALLWAGCQHGGAAAAAAAKARAVALYAETPGAPGQTWQLPQSGVAITTAPTPVITGEDILGLQPVTLELGKAVLVQLTLNGAAELTRQADALRGKRLVLVVNGAPIGALRINPPLRDRQIVVFVELNDGDLQSVVNAVNPAIVSGPKRALRL